MNPAFTVFKNSPLHDDGVSHNICKIDREISCAIKNGYNSRYLIRVLSIKRCIIGAVNYHNWIITRTSYKMRGKISSIQCEKWNGFHQVIGVNTVDIIYLWLGQYHRKNLG